MGSRVHVFEYLPTRAFSQTTYPVKMVRATLSGVMRTASSQNELADLRVDGGKGNNLLCGSHILPPSSETFHSAWSPPPSVLPHLLGTIPVLLVDRAPRICSRGVWA